METSQGPDKDGMLYLTQPTSPATEIVENTATHIEQSVVANRSLILVDHSIPCPLWRRWKESPDFQKNRASEEGRSAFGSKAAVRIFPTTIVANAPLPRDILADALRLGLRGTRKNNQKKLGVQGVLKLRTASGLTQETKAPDNKQEKKRKAFQVKANKDKETLSLTRQAKRLKAFLMKKSTPMPAPVTATKADRTLDGNGHQNTYEKPDNQTMEHPMTPDGQDNFVDLTEEKVEKEEEKLVASWQIEDSSWPPTSDDSADDQKSAQSESRSETMGTAPGLNPTLVRLFEIRKTDAGHEFWLDETVLKDVASKLLREIVAEFLP